MVRDLLHRMHRFGGDGLVLLVTLHVPVVSGRVFRTSGSPEAGDRQSHLTVRQNLGLRDGWTSRSRGLTRVDRLRLILSIACLLPH